MRLLTGFAVNYGNAVKAEWQALVRREAIDITHRTDGAEMSERCFMGVRLDVVCRDRLTDQFALLFQAMCLFEIGQNT
tara:strand:+ start:221 stop:454 length:234 start_codon:yes stop_codon:yes gene_type:complete